MNGTYMMKSGYKIPALGVMSLRADRRFRGDVEVTRGGRVVKKLGFWGDVIYG